MKRLNLVLFGLFLLNFCVFAQIGGTTQRGRATQEMTSEGFFAAHSSFPLGSSIRVVNTTTGQEVYAVVSGRIPASPNRVVDLSKDVWDTLGLNERTVVMLGYAPPPAARQTPTASEPAPVTESREYNSQEIDRLKPTQPLYHLLILDRRNCEEDSDISDMRNIKLMYKFAHNKKGYLVAVFVSTTEGPVFPVMPDRSRILVNFITTDLAFIKDYTNSPSFKRFVTNKRAISELQVLLK